MDRNLALILTPVLFWAAITAWKAWRNPSPADPSSAPSDASPQVTATISPADSGGVGEGLTVDELAEWMRVQPSYPKATPTMQAAMREHSVSSATAWRAWAKARPAPGPGPVGRLLGGKR